MFNLRMLPVYIALILDLYFYLSYYLISVKLFRNLYFSSEAAFTKLTLFCLSVILSVNLIGQFSEANYIIITHFRSF